MKRTSLYLLVTLFWMLMLRAVLLAQSLPQVEHTQSMHQYILQEAFTLLQREEPGLSMKLKERIGNGDPGAHPWQVRSIMAGTYREDCEDIVYSFGGSDKALWPDLVINTPGPCLPMIYDEFKKELMKDENIALGMVTVSHFWDATAQDNYVGKDGVAVDADGLMSCLSTPNQTVTIKVPVNAWDKMQKLARPMGTAIRDFWWPQGEAMYDRYSNIECVLPQHVENGPPMLIKYNTLADLYNDGLCAIRLPGEAGWREIVMTDAQRNKYVWEIFGRMCHLLADMSVPAHTHKDMHMGNVVVEKPIERLGVKLGTVRLTVQDADSYENWVSSPVQRFWTAGLIRDGLIDISSVGDPLYHLMSTMRDMAASFASDDFDGTGPGIGVPRYAAEIPDRHTVSNGQMSIIKQSLMCNIRENTLPYAIRATATLMAWFAAQLNMEETYEVRNVGTAGYDDFYTRDSFTDPFPVSGTYSGTLFTRQAGDELSLRSHVDPHPQTGAKFRVWSDQPHGMTTQHQFDDYVAEKQIRVDAKYDYAVTSGLPIIGNFDEMGKALHNRYQSFRDPWCVNKSEMNAWELPQRGVFAEYQPAPVAPFNGGVFLNAYDPTQPDRGYYSIRASNVLESATLTHKWPGLDVGDYAFIDWETIRAEMYADPQNAQTPPHPAYPNPEQYDTKIVDFLQPHAIVNAHYKAHRTAVLRHPPTRSNSQRKVALDDGETYHAVYESSDRIWYVRSGDGGGSWSGEMLVSDMGTHAARPSIAASGSSAWIAYVEGGEIVLRVQTDRRWEDLYRVPVSMAAESTPAIAVLGEYEGCAAKGKVVCLVWEDHDVLKFAVLNGPNVLVDDQVLVRGHQQPTSVDQPRYPSVAASTMPFAKPTFDHGFHIAWIENGAIYYCRLGIDRRSVPPGIQGWVPGGSVTTETVHGKTGSVGALYPARHAPSIAVTQNGTVHVGFDVVSSWSAWPQVGVKPGGLPSSFALRERPLPTLHGPTWQTTTTLMSSGNNAAQLCSPSVGARPASGVVGNKSTGLRIAYNEKAGLINVLRVDGTLDVRPHEDGDDPNLTVWSQRSEGLLDVFSIDASLPYDWHMLSSTNNLARTAETALLRQRQLVMKKGESIAALGLSDLRLTGDTGDERSLVWAPAHDSLILNVQASVAEKMRSETFIPADGEHLRLTLERFAAMAEDANAEVLLNITDARTDEILRVVNWPVAAFASVQGMATQDVDLGAFRGIELRVSADVYTDTDEWDISVIDRYAMLDQEEGDDMEKGVLRSQALAPELQQNHPNPFNPATSISFVLHTSTRLRLTVSNLLGEVVATVAEGRYGAGTHVMSFDGSTLPTGVYVYRLETDGTVLTRTMHLLK